MGRENREYRKSRKCREQAGDELCQAQVKLEVILEVGMESGACHYYPGGWVDSNKTNA